MSGGVIKHRAKARVCEGQEENHHVEEKNYTCNELLVDIRILELSSLTLVFSKYY